jgi:hypothetical protein
MGCIISFFKKEKQADPARGVEILRGILSNHGERAVTVSKKT